MNDDQIALLKSRYLDGEETPDEMFDRVATCVSGPDNLNYKETYRSIMQDLLFLPNSPTLMNAGRQGGLSACYVIPVEDSMDSIFEAVKEAAIITKAAGGVGIDLSKIRSNGSPVGNHNGIASGPCSFIHNFNQMIDSVKQGGRRRGAMIGILRCDHPEIIEFIKIKEQDGVLSNFNLSVAITEDFMNAVASDLDFNLIDPFTKKITKTLPAREIWNLIVEKSWTNGEPGIVFIDQINAKNPVPELGRIDATNPCSELPLPPYGSCNLGSINLAKCVFYDPEYNRNKVACKTLEHVVKTAVRFLDNVIEVNLYPLPQIKKEAYQSRRIGLGVMGWADMLYQLGIRYGSSESLKLADSLGKFIYNAANDASIELAHEKGPYQGWREGMPYRRNATLLTVAPTGSISLIAGCSSGIEPIFSLMHKRKTFEGIEMNIVNRHFENRLDDHYDEQAKRQIIDHLVATGHTDGLLTPEDKEVFVASHDILPREHVLMQAAWQRHIDNSISKTVNLPNSATRDEVGDILMLAWQNGCKGVTVYRDGSRANQVLTRTQEIHPKQRPNVVSGVTEKVATGCGNMYVTVNQENDKPFETFAILGRSGSCNKAMTEGLARLVSLCLRSGVAVDDIIKQLSGLRCQSPTMGPMGCSSCPDGIAKALARSCDITVETKLHAGQCPECGEILIMQEGCAYCTCGYGKCS